MALSNNYIFGNCNSDITSISNNKKIITVNNIKLFEDFYKVSWRVYHNNKYWVAPFWTEFKSFY